MIMIVLIIIGISNKNWKPLGYFLWLYIVGGVISGFMSITADEDWFTGLFMFVFAFGLYRLSKYLVNWKPAQVAVRSSQHVTSIDSQMKKCPNCGFELPVASNRCPSCRQEIGKTEAPQTAVSTNSTSLTRGDNSDGWKICPGCGTELPATFAFCPVCRLDISGPNTS